MFRPFGIRIPVRARDFSLPKPVLEHTQHPIQWVRGFFRGYKRSWREVNYSSPTSAGVKNVWSLTSTPTVCLHGVDKNNFSFVFLNFTFLYKLALATQPQHVAGRKANKQGLQTKLCMAV
jgi:hypothetical protein